MTNVESLWKDYNSYEQSTNVLIAKKMIDDKNKEFINARRATKELEVLQRTLLKNNPAVPMTGSVRVSIYFSVDFSHRFRFLILGALFEFCQFFKGYIGGSSKTNL